jgi:hypothetical protein
VAQLIGVRASDMKWHLITFVGVEYKFSQISNEQIIMGGFTCDVLAVKICKLFELDFQNLLVLLQVISLDMCLSKIYSLVDN